MDILLDAVRHPKDIVDTNRMRNSKFVQLILKTYSRMFSNDKRIEKMLNMEGLRLSEEVYPEHYQILKETCKTLNMTVPELYFAQISVPGESFVINNRQYIVLRTDCSYKIALAEVELIRQCFNLLLTPMECRGMSVLVLKLLAKINSFPASAVISTVSSIYSSKRRYLEMSVDRATVTYLRSGRKFFDYLISISFISAKQISDEGYEEFVRQAQETAYLSTKERKLLQRALRKMGMADKNMPTRGVRFGDIIKWIDSDEYKKLICCLDTPSEAKEWPLPVSSKDALETNCEELKKMFLNGNFSNVTCIEMPADNSENPAKVTSVSVGGKTEFEYGQWTDKNLPVIISCE